MFFNISKCFLVRICSSLTSPQSLPDTYTIDNYLIKRCSHHKDLGVVLCSDLSWSLHIQGITAKTYQALGLLRRIQSSHPPTITLYLTYSVKTYGVPSMSKNILCKSRQKVEVGVGGGGREAQNVYILNFKG